MLLQKAIHEKEPLVSIITLTYNHERFIERCVRSVLAQTYPNWEQIVIDDGSTDNTSDVVSRFADPRIRLQRQTNKGPFELANTYNRALSLAKGELIGVLEGDDFWPANKLASLVPAFQDPAVVLAYGEAQEVDDRDAEESYQSYTTQLRTALPRSVLMNDPIGAATRYMLLGEGRSLVAPSTVIIRRAALQQIGGFQYVAGLPLTDYPTFLELSLKGEFFYRQAILGYRRRYIGSITSLHLDGINEHVCSFCLRFLENHRDELKLSVAQHGEMERSWRRFRHKHSFAQGRFLLVQRRWIEARSRFRAALRSREPLVWLASMTGYLFSFAHSDLEPLMNLVGRARLRSEG
jgi:glycosyltransferase involved in cell wall biosynthesis